MRQSQHDFYVVVVHRAPFMITASTVNLVYASIAMKRSFHLIEQIGSALTVARTKGIERLYSDELPFQEGDYALLIDDDILIANNWSDIVKSFSEAEDLGINIIGGYVDAHNNPTYKFIVDNEVQKTVPLDTFSKAKTYLKSMRDWQLPLGFYYGRIPKGYVFRMSDKGEDFNFFDDNKDIHSHTFLDERINLGHYKSGFLFLPKS